jgi:aryl-alcohol dehydrogenase-like predicted oxidoreductase
MLILAMNTAHLPAELVLGTEALGHLAPEEASKLVRNALSTGIGWIASTCADVSGEPQIAAALPGMKGVRIATKIAPINDRDTGAVRRALIDGIYRSCARLRTDRLDALLLDDTRHLKSHAGVVWHTIKHLRDHGVIFDLGVCVREPNEALAALNDPDVRHIEIAFAPFDRRWRAPAVADALAERPWVTVHARAAGYPSRMDAERIATLARDLGRESPIDLCLAYMRATDWINGAIVDVDSHSELALSRKLFDRPVLNRDELAMVDRTLADLPRIYRIA